MKRNRLLVAIFASIAVAGWSQEIVVESFPDGNNSQAFSQVEGKWTESTAKSTAPGLKATKSVFNDANTDPAVARFTPEIPTAWNYEVFITYPTSGNATDIKYKIVSADGTKELTITQNGRDFGASPAANQWFSLGTYNFAAGNSGYVELSDPLTGAKPLANEPNARIYADAVKFVPEGSATAAAPATTTPATTVVAAATTPAAPATGLPSLPGAATPAAADMPGLPAVQAAAADAMPGLPSATSETGAAAKLPGLPAAAGTQSAATALPSLPGAASATPSTSAAMPALPAATPAEVAQQNLPALPATTPTPAGGLPDLSISQPAATETPIVTAQATPYPAPNLPSLAPVTPTPQRTLPSPADTPVAGQITGLPGGALSNLPPTPAISPMATPMAGFAAPTPFSGIPGASQPAATTATPAPGTYSITTHNPANLQWMYDFGAALNTARSQNKRVMIFFTAEGNRAGETYETQYFMHPTVRQALDNYVLVKVDFSKNTRLAYSLGVFGAGVIVVTDTAGDVISRVVQLPPTPVDLLKQMSGVKATAVTASGASPAPGAAATTGTAAGAVGPQ